MQECSAKLCCTHTVMFNASCNTVFVVKGAQDGSADIQRVAEHHSNCWYLLSKYYVGTTVQY